jgi:hypothetical protein
MSVPTMGPDFGDERLAAFRRYCADGTTPVVSREAMGYVRHCLAKAARNAALMGEEPDVFHHQAFALMALETGHPERIPDFLMALQDPSGRPGVDHGGDLRGVPEP